VSSSSPTHASRRLIVITRADPTGRYGWIPPLRPDDLTVALDGVAYRDLASRRPLLFDEVVSWEERSAGQRCIVELLAAIREHPAVAALEHEGHALIDFAELRLHRALEQIWRGWKLASAAGAAGELVHDPQAPPALTMGARAALGLDPASVHFRLSSALPGSRARRALARPAMRALAARSRPELVRVAAVAAGKLALALSSLSVDELHAASVGVMPFPGLDHGNGALLAVRRRLPLLATYGSTRTGPGPVVRIPSSLDLCGSAALDHALTLLLGRLLAAAASELAHAVDALAGLERTGSLRALLLPSSEYGASRLLIGWACKHGVQVATMQHGVYFYRVDYGERMTDVLFGWGPHTAEQTVSWPEPRPRVLSVGLPGVAAARARAGERHSIGRLSRTLIATTGEGSAPITPTTFCDTFLDVIASGLMRLAASGVELELRPHPSEDAARYRRLLDAHGLDVRISTQGSFSAAAAQADLLIASTSSVAFEAAALGLPVLLWFSDAPQWVRREHFVPPWIDRSPGMFEQPEEFAELVEDLLVRPDVAFQRAQRLGRVLTRYAEPFRPDRFAASLLELSA
jgi:hypothetical protein